MAQARVLVLDQVQSRWLILDVDRARQEGVTHELQAQHGLELKARREKLLLALEAQRAGEVQDAGEIFEAGAGDQGAAVVMGRARHECWWGLWGCYAVGEDAQPRRPDSPCLATSRRQLRRPVRLERPLHGALHCENSRGRVRFASS